MLNDNTNINEKWRRRETIRKSRRPAATIGLPLFRMMIISFSAACNVSCLSLLLSLWLLAVVSVNGLMPPHPNYIDYESIFDMHNRLNITRMYKSKYLNPEHCRYLSDKQCEEEDSVFGKNRERHLQKQRERKRRRLQQGQRHLNPSRGTFKALVLLIRFKGDENKQLADVGYLNTVFNGGENDDDINPVGSISEYMYYSSLGEYNIEFVFASNDWDMAPQPASYYAGGQSGRLGGLKMQDVLTWKLDELDRQGYDFSPLDADEDMQLDMVVALHSGYPAEFGRLPCDKNPEDRIWSQASNGIYPDGWVSSDSYKLSGYVLASGVGVKGMCNDPEPLFKMATVSHEMMHCFSCIDVYDGDQDDKRVHIGGLAKFDIMAFAYGWNTDADRPGHLSAWSRIVAGWLEPIVISRNGVYALQPSEISGTVYKISAGYPSGEYLLIENRGAMKWSSDMPHAGILIFHIDESRDLYMSTRGYPGHTNWSEEHYIVALQQQDGKYDLEQGNNLGDEGDYWGKGMAMGPNVDGTTWPNTDTYQDGVVEKTGIKITIMSDPGFIMRIRVEGVPGGDVSTSNYAPGALMPVDPGDNDAYNVEKDVAGGGNVGIGGGPVDLGILAGGKEVGVDTTGRTIAWILSVLSSLAVVFGVLAVFFF